MPTVQYDTTITADRMIRIPDDWDLEIGDRVRVTRVTPDPPTAEEADALAARFKARLAELDAGIDEPDENGFSLKSFGPLRPLPPNWKFDREEIHERGQGICWTARSYIRDVRKKFLGHSVQCLFFSIVYDTAAAEKR